MPDCSIRFPFLSSVQRECENFEYMLWFESLLFYGFDEQSALQRGDGDNGLLPSIVEKVIVSRLTGRKNLQQHVKIYWTQYFRTLKTVRSCFFISVLAEQVWDPLSSSQTARLVDFVHRLMKGYPTVLHGDNKYTQVFSYYLYNQDIFI